MGIKKAQVFTTCNSGLDQPTIVYGETYAKRKSLDDSFAHFTFRGSSSSCNWANMSASYDTECKSKKIIWNFKKMGRFFIRWVSPLPCL